jgi:hypothetical protein
LPQYSGLKSKPNKQQEITSNLKIEAVRSPETSVNFNLIIQRHITEDSHHCDTQFVFCEVRKRGAVFSVRQEPIFKYYLDKLRNIVYLNNIY